MTRSRIEPLAQNIYQIGIEKAVEKLWADHCWQSCYTILDWIPKVRDGETEVVKRPRRYPILHYTLKNTDLWWGEDRSPSDC